MPECSRDPAVGVRQRSRDRLPAPLDWRTTDVTTAVVIDSRPLRRLRPRRSLSVAVPIIVVHRGPQEFLFSVPRGYRGKGRRRGSRLCPTTPTCPSDRVSPTAIWCWLRSAVRIGQGGPYPVANLWPMSRESVTTAVVVLLHRRRDVIPHWRSCPAPSGSV